MSITCETEESRFSFGRQRFRGCHVGRQHVDAVRVGHRIVQQIAQRLHRLGMRVLACRADPNRTAAAGRWRLPGSPARRQPSGSASGGAPPADPAVPAQAKPTNPPSPGGRHRVIAAGRKVIVQTKAISMPAPAISPSSATPMKLVGTKARNPAEVAGAATRIWLPTRWAFCRIASAGSGYSNRRSRYRTENWIAKSTAMPTNSTPNATETRFSVPTATVANSSVSDQPECQRAEDRHDQPPGVHRQEQPQGDQQHAADQAGDGALRDRGELCVGQCHLPGDAHSRRSRLDELKLGDVRLHRPSSLRRPAPASRNPGAAAPARSGIFRRGRTGCRPAGSPRTAAGDGRPARRPAPDGKPRIGPR